MNRPVKHCSIVFAGALFAISNLKVTADTSWINPSSGLWGEAANWSFGVPHMGQATTHISFGGESKTVTVDPTTPATNLVIQRLRMEPSGVTNTLLLTGVVFEARSTIEMRRIGAALHIVQSTLRLPSVGSSFDVNAGEVRLESGSIEAANVSTRIGRDGGLATMRMEGGTASFNEVLVGRRVSQSGAQGIVLLSGGRLEISGNLDVGADTNCTGQIVVTGGEMIATATNFSTAIGEQGNGTLTISNGVVRFDDVDVGRHTNVIGMLYVAGGSNLINDLALARFPLSTGMVFQTAGQLVTDAIRVGEEGHGEMTIFGGELMAETLVVAGATNTASGALRIDGGTTIVESNLVVSTNGRIQFNSGFLSCAGTAVSNGVPFVIGDGTNAATFHMEGGTHYFDNGLVISPNGRLTGCGTIIGTISNQGTIATNCGPPAPHLVNPIHTGAQFSFSFASKGGVSYTIESTPTVDAITWNVVTVTNGTGGTITIRDSATGDARFYRARVQ